ncbi:MAG: hypothetical protein J6W67_04150, partial [Lentisphaeria bacterium]|nr:hypothetical protein [Lentisphaeria bacterium]
EGRGESGKTSFLAKRSFPAFPASSPHIRNKALKKTQKGRKYLQFEKSALYYTFSGIVCRIKCIISV